MLATDIAYHLVRKGVTIIHVIILGDHSSMLGVNRVGTVSWCSRYRWQSGCYGRTSTKGHFFFISRGSPNNQVSFRILYRTLTVSNLILLHVWFFLSLAFDSSVSSVWDYDNSVEQYQVSGGTSRRAVQEQIDNLKRQIQLRKISDDSTMSSS